MLFCNMRIVGKSKIAWLADLKNPNNWLDRLAIRAKIGFGLIADDGDFNVIKLDHCVCCSLFFLCCAKAAAAKRPKWGQELVLGGIIKDGCSSALTRIFDGLLLTTGTNGCSFLTTFSFESSIVLTPMKIQLQVNLCSSLGSPYFLLLLPGVAKIFAHASFKKFATTTESHNEFPGHTRACPLLSQWAKNFAISATATAKLQVWRSNDKSQRQNQQCANVISA